MLIFIKRSTRPFRPYFWELKASMDNRCYMFKLLFYKEKYEFVPHQLYLSENHAFFPHAKLSYDS